MNAPPPWNYCLHCSVRGLPNGPPVGYAVVPLGRTWPCFAAAYSSAVFVHSSLRGDGSGFGDKDSFRGTAERVIV